jgi:2-hydroxyacyl-CoA lyase 1
LIILILAGFPVTAILEQVINHGIRYIGFRNEQAASYAATAYGYLTGKPACCVVVGGPGVVHALAGVVNSSGNTWPLLLLAGSCETYHVGKGSFQELDAVSMLSPHVKVALRPSSASRIPSAVQQAYRSASTGRPGTGFVDLPADFLQAKLDPPATPLAWRHPISIIPSADEAKVFKITQVLKSATAPLFVFGKGSAYARAENVLRRLVESTQVPFLPSPMGKGIVPDSHPCNISAARSTALRNADVVLVFGARLNWILHFGESPKWNPHAKIIQVDIDADVIGQNAGDGTLGVVSDVNSFTQKLIATLGNWRYSSNTPFRQKLEKEMSKNAAILAKQAQIKTVPLKFEHAYHVIRTTLDSLSPPSDGGIVYISEGARTMDTSRLWFFQEHPRLRLDAGTHGTMGIGFGYAIAAWEAYNAPQAEASSGKPGRKKVVGLIGDSATGFSGMEIETMVRMGMDCLIFVMNNGGVYHGHADSQEEFSVQQKATKEGRGADGLRSWSLGFETRYDLFADAVGGKGFLVRTSEELQRAAEEGFKADVPVIVNVLVESGKGFPAVSDAPREDICITDNEYRCSVSK